MPSGHAVSSIGWLTYMLLETWVDRPQIVLRRKVTLSTVLLIILAPTPYSRVYLHDHSSAQVGVGGCLGAVLGGLWFLFMYKAARPRLDGWSDRCSSALRNTYRTEAPSLLDCFLQGDAVFEARDANKSARMAPLI